ncbi:hypothetical protein PHYPSEUDO_000506 [Phytophthora pseudosyringae]|uniref:Uncharacterized protein n=1 Tax=Phytophthora pseudosyringae TaxID=221518 RepID=A0A8T1V665_9STRA|nr:hypothetical protein PHYPSEUDO_000506 [Phytophthora pseudosyringae]
MERGMRRKPANDIQFGRYKPPGVNPGLVTRGNPGAKAPAAYAAATSRESRELSSDELQWEDEDDEAGGYQYDEENNDYDAQSPRQEDVFRADAAPRQSPSDGRRFECTLSHELCNQHDPLVIVSRNVNNAGKNLVAVLSSVSCSARTECSVAPTSGGGGLAAEKVAVLTGRLGHGELSDETR